MSVDGELRGGGAGFEVVDEDAAGGGSYKEGDAVAEKGDAGERVWGGDDLDDLFLKDIVKHDSLVEAD